MLYALEVFMSVIHLGVFSFYDSRGLLVSLPLVVIVNNV